MKRRTFLVQALLAPVAALAATAAWLQSCGGGGMYTSTSVACDGRAPTVSLAADGHTHYACVPMAAYGTTGYTLVLQSSVYVNHSHTVALSQADLTTIAGGGPLGPLPSTSDGVPPHNHTVTF